MAHDFLLLILSSPSGAGKTTLTRMLQERYPELRFSVSHTTRHPRPKETDGKDYHFVTRERFCELVAEEAFLEWAEVHGNLYGTSVAEIDRGQATPGCRGMIFDIDYQGARQIRAKVHDAIGVFILPPSMEELERRLRGRASDSEEVILRRFQAAKREIDHYALFDYVVLNDDLQGAFEHLAAIVLAERSRRARRAHLAEALLRMRRRKRKGCAAPCAASFPAASPSLAARAAAGGAARPALTRAPARTRGRRRPTTRVEGSPWTADHPRRRAPRPARTIRAARSPACRASGTTSSRAPWAPRVSRRHDHGVGGRETCQSTGSIATCTCNATSQCVSDETYCQASPPASVSCTTDAFGCLVPTVTPCVGGQTCVVGIGTCRCTNTCTSVERRPARQPPASPSAR